MKEQVLVTGGSGFIGSEIIKVLYNKGYDIVSFDIKEEEDKMKGVFYIQGDIRDKTLLHTIGKNARYIFHTAGILGTSLLIERMEDTFHINIIGSTNVFGLAAETGATVINPGLIPRWGSPYMISKNFVKDVGELYNEYDKTDIRTVELTHAYGPGQSPYQAKAVPNFIINALLGSKITVFGDVDGEFKYMDLIYSSDAAEALVRIAEEPKLKGQILQLGCGESIAVDILAVKIINMCGSDSNIIYAPMRDGEPDGREKDFQHADLTNWHKHFKDSPVQVSLEDGLNITIRKYKQDLDEGRIDISKLQ